MDVEKLYHLHRELETHRWFVARIIFITKDKKILIAKRPADANVEKGKWTLLGGKIDKKIWLDSLGRGVLEHHRSAAVREATQELTLTGYSLQDILSLVDNKRRRTDFNIFDIKPENVKTIMGFSSSADPNDSKRAHTLIIAISLDVESSEIQLRDNPEGDTKPNTDLTAFDPENMPPSDEWAFNYSEIVELLCKSKNVDDSALAKLPNARVFKANLRWMQSMLDLSYDSSK